MAAFCDEIKGVFIKQEPLEEHSGTDVNGHGEAVEVKVEEIKPEIDVKWRELKVEKDLETSSTPLQMDRVETFKSEKCDMGLQAGPSASPEDLVKKPRYARRFQCEKCYCKFKHKSTLIEHVMDKHVTADERRWFKCGKCDYKSKEKKAVKLHMIGKHLKEEDARWFQCEKCSYKTVRKCVMPQHMASKHQNGEDFRWFQCGKCDYKSKERQQVQLHMISNHFNAGKHKCT